MPKRKQLVPRNVTKFNVPCAFGGQASEVAIFIGNPESKHNPIHFQAKFIQDVRGGVIPQSVLESLEKLQKLSIENGVPFEELCKYALTSISQSDTADNQSPAVSNNTEQQPKSNAIPAPPSQVESEEDQIITESTISDKKVNSDAIQSSPLTNENSGEASQVEENLTTQPETIDKSQQNSSESHEEDNHVESEISSNGDKESK